MANLTTKIKQYAAANSVASVDFSKDVRVIDHSDGQGPYIKEWNLAIPKPTDEQLSTYESSANDVEALNVILNNRKAEYPSWQDQMDMQYHDQVNDTTTWKDAIQAVKDANPKP